MSGGDWKEMFLACQSGDLELVKLHIETGVDLNYKHPEFLTTALIESIRSKHREITEYLLDNGADPTIKDDWTGETALSLAEALRDSDLTNLLKSSKGS